MAFPWSDPIGALGPIPKHPVTDSELSSTLSNYTNYQTCEDDAVTLLELFGEPAQKDDVKTLTLLRTFRRYLPKQGQLALDQDIIAIGRDDDKIRALANHIRDAVLKPSM